MPKVIEGKLVVKPGARFGIAVSRFNTLVTERLLEGAVDCLVRHGVDDANITVMRVPGAYELPLAVKALCAKGNQGVIALGCVIKGDTPHFDYVAGQASSGITQAALESRIPVAFGLLTCDNLEQALDRAGAKGGNKGWEAAASVIEMVDVLPKL
jgi:6,7-dimethyl-8-ribityllumazine synthase